MEAPDGLRSQLPGQGVCVAGTEVEMADGSRCLRGTYCVPDASACHLLLLKDLPGGCYYPFPQVRKPKGEGPSDGWVTQRKRQSQAGWSDRKGGGAAVDVGGTDSPIYPSIHQSSHPPTHLRTHPCIRPSTHPFIHPSIHSSNHPSIHSSPSLPSFLPSFFPSSLPPSPLPPFFLSLSFFL